MMKLGDVEVVRAILTELGISDLPTDEAVIQFVTATCPLLTSVNREQRALSAVALSNWGDLAQACFKELEAAVSNADREYFSTRAMAATALGRLVKPHAEDERTVATLSLAAALADGNPNVRNNVANALAEIGYGVPAAIQPQLAERLRETLREEAALQARGKGGSAGLKAIGAIAGAIAETSANTASAGDKKKSAVAITDTAQLLEQHCVAKSKAVSVPPVGDKSQKTKLAEIPEACRTVILTLIQSLGRLGWASRDALPLLQRYADDPKLNYAAMAAKTSIGLDGIGRLVSSLSGLVTLFFFAVAAVLFALLWVRNFPESASRLAVRLEPLDQVSFPIKIYGHDLTIPLGWITGFRFLVASDAVMKVWIDKAAIAARENVKNREAGQFSEFAPVRARISSGGRTEDGHFSLGWCKEQLITILAASEKKARVIWIGGNPGHGKSQAATALANWAGWRVRRRNAALRTLPFLYCFGARLPKLLVVRRAISSTPRDKRLRR